MLLMLMRRRYAQARLIRVDADCRALRPPLRGAATARVSFFTPLFRRFDADDAALCC